MHRLAPIILAVALFMEQLDSTIISTALPVIAADLGVGPITLKLALTAYLVALGVFIPLSGWMADRFGARRVFLAAILVFMAGSLACAFAEGIAGFVIARFVQGMGGAMMTPVGRAIVLKSADRADLVSAMTLFTLPAVVAPLFGPPVGGFIATYWSWEWIFLVNVPIGLAGLVLAILYVPDVPPEPVGRPDVTGFVLAGLGTAGIVFGLSVISLPALPPALGAAAVAIGLLSAWACFRHARHHPDPALRIALFGVPTFSVSVLAGSLFRVSMGAVPFLTPLMLQLGFGMTAFESGMVTFSGAFGMIFTKLIAKGVLRRHGFRPLLVTTAILAAIGTAAYGLFSPGTPAFVMIAVFVAAGLVRSLFFTAINILAYADIPKPDMSAATAINGVMQQASVALGIALAGVVLEVAPLLTGESLSLADFHMAFLLAGLLTLSALLPVLRLDRKAGADVAGHVHAD